MLQPEFLQASLEALAILRQVDRFERRTKYARTIPFQAFREPKGRLSPELDDDASQFPITSFHFQDAAQGFHCQRFKIESIGSVRIGGYRLRIAVDHYGLVTCLRQRKAGVAAAVVKLYSLPDPVWPPAQDNYLFPVAWTGLVLRDIHLSRVRARFPG